MKGILVYTVSFVLSLGSFAQSPPKEPTETAASQLETIDLIAEREVFLADSLQPSYAIIDSLRNEFAVSADSLQNQYRKNVTDINTRTTKLTKKIDSLQHLNLPTRKHIRSVKSLSDLKMKSEQDLRKQLHELKARTTDRLNSLELPDEYREPLQQLNTYINGADLKKPIQIPKLKLPGYEMPGINSIGKMPSLDEISNGVNLPEPPNTTGDLGNISQEAQAYQSKVQEISESNLTNVEKLPQTIESEASRVDGIDELRKQSDVLNGHKSDVAQLADPRNAKEKATEMAKQAAINHFAGREKQLKSAIEKISKYKQKYSSVSSIKDLSKRPPNAMKGKPFVERLIPGVYLQYQQKNFYLIDINPYVGYKISGRITSGIGWNQRYAYDKATRSFDSRSNIFGPRGFVDFKLGKGFIAHVEGESMNTFVPSTLQGNPDAGHREWVWGLMTGIKKEYRIYKNLKGTALIQYNVFNRYYKAPYVDRLNSRIGFEYTLKQTRKNGMNP